jgi:hypothetical protein
MRAFPLLGFLALTSLAATQNLAQTATPDGRVHTRIEGIDIPPVPNAPFTAKVVVTWDQPLVGGGAISRRYYTMVARDSQGRVYRETRDFIPANSDAEPPLRSFAITDPVGSSRITCTQDGMSCTVVDFRPALTSPKVAVAPPLIQAKGFSRQSLGDQTMESQSVIGARETTTSSAGTRDDTRLVISSKDLWFSPDLQMYLSVVRRDPQLGQISLTVTDLLRREPAPSWFSIPPGYTTVDARRNPSASERSQANPTPAPRSSPAP